MRELTDLEWQNISQLPSVVERLSNIVTKMEKASVIRDKEMQKLFNNNIRNESKFAVTCLPLICEKFLEKDAFPAYFISNQKIQRDDGIKWISLIQKIGWFIVSGYVVFKIISQLM